MATHSGRYNTIDNNADEVNYAYSNKKTMDEPSL